MHCGSGFNQEVVNMAKCTCAFPCGGTEPKCPSSPAYGKPTSEEVIKELRYQLERHQRLLRGIAPYLEQEGYDGFVGQIEEILRYKVGDSKS